MISKKLEKKIQDIIINNKLNYISKDIRSSISKRNFLIREVLLGLQPKRILQQKPEKIKITII